MHSILITRDREEELSRSKDIPSLWGGGGGEGGGGGGGVTEVGNR